MKIDTICYNYNSVPTVRAFTLSSKRVKCIIGPLGSGKSSGCVMALLRNASQQEPKSKDNTRYTRFVIIRNTLKELKDTTKKTIDEWITCLQPKWRESENKYILHYALPDKTIVHSEWLLRALDRPEQIRDLLSLEISGAWFNEAREIPKEVFDMVDTRIGRYPRKEGNFKCTYPSIIMDSNPPDDDCWLYKLFEEEVLKDPALNDKIELFKQPSGLSADAENISNLVDDYYLNLMVGKDDDFVKVYVHGEYGYVKEGKPVFSNFVPSLHIATEQLFPIKTVPLLIGMDFGLFPACVILQITTDGRLKIFDEIVSEDASDVEETVQSRLLPFLRQHKYTGFSHILIGDPAGAARSQLDSRSCFQVLRKAGVKAYPAATNSLQMRIQAVNQYLTRLTKGVPAFQISPTCSILIKGLAGKYAFKRLRISGERYTNVPDKNFYSHICDALTYACVGSTLKFNIPYYEEFSSKASGKFSGTRLII